MESNNEYWELPSPAGGLPTIYPASLPVEQLLDRFWQIGAEFNEVTVRIAPPETPLSVLKQLGPSPFERGGFPIIGFLATTYDKVSRYALERAANRPTT